ncbi:hypothetical protein KAI65_02470 [Candidatus Parcubacteria bacterium]|nr:hypothetical protein [Candidatus Parcubacteria bacterium]
MNGKFSSKDYLAYVFAGILWIIIILYFFYKIRIINYGMIIKINNIQYSYIYVTIFLLFSSYLIGHLLRFTKIILIFLGRILYGNPFYWILATDKNNKKNCTRKKFGLFQKLTNKKRNAISINKRCSKLIEENLKKLNIFDEQKIVQFNMATVYLDLQYDSLIYVRLKDLKYYYQSIFAPFVVTCCIFIYEIFYIDINFIYKILFLLIIALIINKFIIRYNTLFTGYIKMVYRYFLFLP